MKQQEVIENCCPVCGSDKSKYLFWTKDYAFQTSEQIFRVNRCLRCSCAYISPRPSKEDISNLYPQEFYWAWENENAPLEWDRIIKKRRYQLEEKAKWLEDTPPGRLLDVGAQKGEFLWLMQKKGWQVEGVELDTSVPNPASMPIRYGDFLEMSFEEGAYDTITFWAVLEHVYDPVKFVQKAKRLLKPGGKLILLVTNIDSIQSRFYCADDFPRHLTIFSKKSLRLLHSNLGFELEKICTDQKIFGASLAGGLVYVTKRLFGYTRDDLFLEWKQLSDPDLFWAKWRGAPSKTMKWISCIDRMVCYPIEVVLDKLGFGMIVTSKAVKQVNTDGA